MSRRSSVAITSWDKKAYGSHLHSSLITAGVGTEVPVKFRIIGNQWGDRPVHPSPSGPISARKGHSGMTAGAWLSESQASVICWASLPGPTPHSHWFYMMVKFRKLKQHRGSLWMSSCLASVLDWWGNRPRVRKYLIKHHTTCESETQG